MVLSNPIGNRPILAEVRAPLPPQRPSLPHAYTAGSTNPVVKPHVGSAARASALETYVPTINRKVASGEASQQQTTLSASLNPSTGGSRISLLQHASTVSKPIPLNPPISGLNQEKGKERGRGGTMSRGNVSKSVARMDAFTWLSNVKVGGTATRESSTDIASGGYGGNSTSGPSSGVGSKSRVRSGLELAGQMQGHSQSQIQEIQTVQDCESQDKETGDGDGGSARGGPEERVKRRESQSQVRGRVTQVQQQMKRKESQDESGQRTSQSRISSEDKKEAENQPLQDE